MKLSEARRLFARLRDLDAIEIRRHAWKDHPERGFSPLELVRLIKARGNLQDNKYPTAVTGSFLWICRDDDGRKTEMAIVFERNESGEMIMVIHAYRKVR